MKLRWKKINGYKFIWWYLAEFTTPSNIQLVFIIEPNYKQDGYILRFYRNDNIEKIYYSDSINVLKDQADIICEIMAKVGGTMRPDLDFSDALKLLKNGHKIWRRGWNGKNMYVTYQSGCENCIARDSDDAGALGVAEDAKITFLPYLMFRTVEGYFIPWLASQSDILANDWCFEKL